jgi:putative membrane protein
MLTAAAVAALSLAACQKKTESTEATNTTTTTTATTPDATAQAAAPDAAQDAAAGPIEGTLPTPAPAAAPAAAATPATTAASSTAPNANGTESTESFVTGVTLSNIYQIDAGKIAETKGQSQGVKDFGAMMIADHTAMTNQMKHVFAATGTTIPTELGPRGKRMIDSLNAASEADFDKLYLSQQQTAQAAELTLLSAYAEGGESSDIRPAAAKAIPKVQGHLDKVHELQAASK